MIYKRFLSAIVSFFAFSLFCPAQNPAVDAGFAPALHSTSSNIFINTEFQPDGKIIASGTFNVVNGLLRYNVVRLNTDGSTDPTFDCQACGFIVSNAMLQPDGKILVAGRESVSQPYEKIIRVNADGSLDTSFNYMRSNQTGTFTLKGIQPDGKILVMKRTIPVTSTYIYRLNPDGSLDNSFSTIVSGSIIDIKVLPDGRTFVFGNSHYGTLALLNSDGSKNSSFESPSLTLENGSTPFLIGITLQSDGKIVVTGRFHSINGITRDGIARLNKDQSVDLSFNPPAQNLGNLTGTKIFSLSNNKVLVSNSGVTNPGRIFRLNSDGSLDNTFTAPTGIVTVSSINVDAAERIYVFTSILRRYNSDGTLDASFMPVFDIAGQVTSLGIQPDGKVLVGGFFSKSNGFSHNPSVSRLNADGTTDTGFDTGQKFALTASILDFGIQPDGKILVGGNFIYDGTGKRIVRLNPNGSLDSAFNVTITGTSSFDTRVHDIELLSDGKILIGGTFESVNGTARTGFARLNSDGTLDTSFNVQLGTAVLLYAVVVQPDGKIMIAGSFSGVNGFNRANVARLNSDGTLDTSFNANQTNVLDLQIQPDGKYLVLRSNTVVRLNSDGSVDNSFTSPALNSGGELKSFTRLSDGSIIIGGTFSVVNGFLKNNIARLNANGAVDGLAFIKGTDGEPRFYIQQPDGKLLIGGAFKVIEDKLRTGLARLNFNPNVRAVRFDFDGDGRADIGVFRPSSNVWYQLVGTNYQFRQRVFGENGDRIVPADFDGDGKTDFAVFRPSNGNWYYITSTDNFARTIHWGQAGDIPLPSDVDGDGRDDFVVYRPSSSNWFRLTTTGQFTEIVFGKTGDKPLIGDFDGDGKADPAIYRPSTGTWWYAASSAGNQFRAVQWGIAEDIPVTGDFDGDGKTDFAVYRPSTGIWYILNSSNDSATVVLFGLNGDKPIAADYDGDGKADIAVYRPSTGEWYMLRTTAGFFGLQFGISEDVPIPNAFVP